MMIKQLSLLSVLSAAAFSVWAQNNNSADNLVVTANRFQQPTSTVLASTSIVTREDIDRWQAKTINDVLRRLPGVDISQNGGVGQASNVYIRGAEARHTLVLIDGIPLAKSGIIGSSDLSQIPLSLVQRMELIRGPRSAVYGSDAIGGVINIITYRSTEGGEVNAGIGSNHFQEYEGSIRHKLSDDTLVTVAGAFEDTRGFNIRPTSSFDGDSDRDGFRNKTLWGGINHAFNDSVSGFIRGYGYSNKTEYDAGYTNGADTRQVYNHTYQSGLNYANGWYSSSLTASYQRYNDYNYSNTLGMYQQNSSLDDMAQRNLQWGNTFAIEQGTISAGVDWQQMKLTSSDNIISDSYKRNNTGYYLTGQRQIETVTLEGSVRGDDNQQFGWNGTWQTAVGWEFIPDYQVTVSYGTGFQAPTLGQLYGQRRLSVISNPDLAPEKSRQWEVGLDGLTGPLNWRLSAYRNQINNLITYYTDEVTWNGSYSNVQSATIQGIEWVGSMDTGIFNHKVTLGYLNPRRDNDNEVLAHRSKQQAKYQLDWTMYEVEMDLSYQYFGKSFENNTNQYAFTQRKMPGYSLVDISASYPVTSHLTIRGKIANLFDKDYETAYGYQTPGREYYLSGGYTF